MRKIFTLLDYIEDLKNSTPGLSCLMLGSTRKVQVKTSLTMLLVACHQYNIHYNNSFVVIHAEKR